MTALIWAGTALALVGVIGLGWSVRMALAIRKSGATVEAAKSDLQKLLIWNMGGLGVALLGILVVVAGVILG